jgi:DNA-binding transcriptional ArsR family regulator
MRAIMNITKALADEKRVRMVLTLRKGELCVCQITELFGLAASTVSKHLSILYQAGLVESRKDGRWVYYRPAGKEAPLAAREAIEWLGKSLSANPLIAEDARRARALSGRSPAQAECCERRERLARRWSEMTGRRGREAGAKRSAR